jgi:hypothetical protein
MRKLVLQRVDEIIEASKLENKLWKSSIKVLHSLGSSLLLTYVKNLKKEELIFRVANAKLGREFVWKTDSDSVSTLLANKLAADLESCGSLGLGLEQEALMSTSKRKVVENPSTPTEKRIKWAVPNACVSQEENKISVIFENGKLRDDLVAAALENEEFYRSFMAEVFKKHKSLLTETSVKLKSYGNLSFKTLQVISTVFFYYF